jgi:predicted DCC family thiol-disulfide oxidoreductase YuxK
MDTHSDKSILLFDGVCNLCNGIVNFVIAQDKKQLFYFASLQSEFGQKILIANKLPTDEFNSFLLLDRGVLSNKSTAALEVAWKLGGFWRILYVLRFLPLFLRDGIYNWVARNRYAWFGKKDQCRIPNPALKKRFL